MAKNPFYSEVSGFVQTELVNRAGHYGKYHKNLEDLNFAHQKQPYLEVHGLDSSGAPTTGITIFTGGFIDTYASNDRYLPKPILTKCSISNLGRYGSTRKAQVDFTVFTRPDLDRLNDIFFIPGAWIQVKYGWTGYTGVDAKNGKLIGRVYNFSFSLREEDGGYNCNFEIVGEGYFPASTDVNSKSTTTFTPGADGNPPLLETGAIGRLRKDIQEFKEGRDKDDVNSGRTRWGAQEEGSKDNFWEPTSPNDTTTVILAGSEGMTKTIDDNDQDSTSLKGNLVTPTDDTKNLLAAVQFIAQSDKDKSEDTYQDQLEVKRGEGEDSIGIDGLLWESEWTYYVNLHYIVDILINNIIRESTNTEILTGNKFYYKCDDLCSKTQMTPNFVAPDPSKVMLLGSGGNYGEEINLNSDQPFANFNWGNFGNTLICSLSRVFINVETVYEILDNHKKENPFQAHVFLNELFKEISFNTGGAIQPMLMIPDDKDADGKQKNYIEVRDGNYVQAEDKDGNPKSISPYVFQAFNVNSVLRNISMESTLPDKMATALFVGGAKSMTGVSQEIQNFYTGGAPVQVPSNTSTNTITDEQAASIEGWKIGWTVFKSASPPSINQIVFYDTSQQAQQANDGEVSGVRKLYYKSTSVYWYIDAKTYISQDVKSLGTAVGNAKVIYEQDKQTGRTRYEAVSKGSIDAIKTLINGYGPVPYITDSTVQAIKQYSQDGPGSATHPWNQRILLPISLGITLDGIEGFEFGNLITTDWLPTKYFDSNQNPQISFIITNVTHTITPNDWSTELETQCRLSPTPTA